MAGDQGEQEEDKLEFAPNAEVPGYISLAQARVLAMTSARETPGGYSRRYRNVPMAFDVVDANEDEDFYNVTLSFRPQGEFSGTSGQEQFFIEKEGRVAHRQVTSLPRQARRSWALPISIGLVIGAVIVAVIVVITIGGTGDDRGLTGMAAPPQAPPSSTTAPADTPRPDTGTAGVTSSNSIVGEVNDAPMAVDDADDADNEGTVEINVTSNDMDVAGDTSTIVSVTDNTEASIYFKKGDGYIEDGKYRLAVDEFTTAISLDPGYTSAYWWRGWAYDYLGQYHEAIQDFDKAIQFDPDDALAYISRGFSYYRSDSYQQAIHDFDKAIQLDPDDAMTYDGRGLAYRMLGRDAEADADEAKACSLNSEYC